MERRHPGSQVGSPSPPIRASRRFRKFERHRSTWGTLAGLKDSGDGLFPEVEASYPPAFLFAGPSSCQPDWRCRSQKGRAGVPLAGRPLAPPHPPPPPGWILFHCQRLWEEMEGSHVAISRMQPVGQLAGFQAAFTWEKRRHRETEEADWGKISIWKERVKSFP